LNLRALPASAGWVLLQTFRDILLRVGLDTGLVKYPASGNDNTPVLPDDQATLYRLKDFVRRANVAFHADFPDGTFRRRTIEVNISNSALNNQRNGSTSEYVLPPNWMGPPQGRVIIVGGRGGSLVLTTMDRVRSASANNSSGQGFPELAACEREPEPSPGQRARWILRFYPSPDQPYTLQLRGRWEPDYDFDLDDIEPTGWGDAIVAYAVHLMAQKGSILTGPSAENAEKARDEWKDRVRREEIKSGPKTQGKTGKPRLANARSTPTIRATNPWS